MSTGHGIAALFLCALAAGAGARRLWPDRRTGSGTGCRHPYGVQLEGSLRVVCLNSRRAGAEELLASFHRAASDGSRLHLRGGEMLILGGAGPARVATLPAPARLTLGLPLDLNHATARDLDLLPKVGKVLARRIIEERERRGRFRRFEELRSVRGVGPATLRRLRPWLVLDGESPLP